MCLPGATCVKGACVDCYTQGCPSGQRCIGRTCAPDPCEGKTCGAGKFCYAGLCVDGCAGVSCGAGRVCVQGACVSSACPTVCAADFLCDPTTATCRPKPCTGIACPLGQVCVNATGRCANDPCEQVHCGQGEACVVKDDGSPDCALPTVTGIPREAKTAGGGMFGCTCGVGGGGGSAGGTMALALMLLWGRGRGRRRR
jgi:hypothetical protein